MKIKTTDPKMDPRGKPDRTETGSEALPSNTIFGKRTEYGRGLPPIFY